MFVQSGHESKKKGHGWVTEWEKKTASSLGRWRKIVG